MRDADRIREKSDLRLDDRQVAALAVAVLLLLGGVFALGLMVGKGLAARAPQTAPPGDLAALDAQRADEPAKPAPKPAASTEPPAVKIAQASIGAPPASPEAPVRQAAAPEQKPAQPVLIDPPKPVVLHAAREPGLTPPPRDLGAFTVQIGASPERAEAQRLEARARAAGLRPYVVEAHLGAKGTWYRVRVGSFKDKDAAGRYRKDVERELRASAVVMPTR